MSRKVGKVTNTKRPFGTHYVYVKLSSQTRRVDTEWEGRDLRKVVATVVLVRGSLECKSGRVLLRGPTLDWTIPLL